MEKVIESRTIYSGRTIDLRLDTLQLPDGTTTEREIVGHRGAVCIVPITSDGIVMVRQYRHAAGRDLLEVPAGTIEPDELPDLCALRELEEETGLTSNRITKLFSAYLAPGYSSELIHAYVALDPSPAGGEHPADADERITVEVMPADQVMNKILTGEIQDSKSIASILTALNLFLSP